MDREDVVDLKFLLVPAKEATSCSCDLGMLDDAPTRRVEALVLEPVREEPEVLQLATFGVGICPFRSS
jgi:hypothetical protein